MTARTASPASALTRRRVLLAVAATVGLAAVGATPAIAAPQATPAAPGAEGWLRVAHLSPDTKAVDIQLSALRGGSSLLELADIGYGVVSDYMLLPVGTYVISMTAADAAPGSDAMIDASVNVTEGKSITVAAFGENRDLRTRVFEDDLTAPEADASRIRLIQASTVTDSVSVETTTGLLIAENARAGQSTNYATVPAGPWDLRLSARGIDDVAPVVLPNGSVNTLFVLDNAEGGLTVMPVLDSASVGAAPVGGVQTGGGALAGSEFLLNDVGSR